MTAIWPFALDAVLQGCFLSLLQRVQRHCNAICNALQAIRQSPLTSAMSMHSIGVCKPCSNPQSRLRSQPPLLIADPANGGRVSVIASGRAYVRCSRRSDLSFCRARADFRLYLLAFFTA